MSNIHVFYHVALEALFVESGLTSSQNCGQLQTLIELINRFVPNAPFVPNVPNRPPEIIQKP